MMTYVRFYKFDCCSRECFRFFIDVLKDLHSFIFSGNSFQIFGPMYLIDYFVTVFLYDIRYDLRVTSSGRFFFKYIVDADGNCLWNDLYMQVEIFNL